MFPLFEVLFILTKRVCLQNIELKYQKLSLFWKARNRFSALPIMVAIMVLLMIMIIIIIIIIIVIILILMIMIIIMIMVMVMIMII